MLSHTAEQPPKPKRPCYRTTIEKRGETSSPVCTFVLYRRRRVYTTSESLIIIHLGKEKRAREGGGPHFNKSSLSLSTLSLLALPPG